MSDINRRTLLTLGAGAVGAVLKGQARTPNPDGGQPGFGRSLAPTASETRAATAFQMRLDAARSQIRRVHSPATVNGDEDRFGSLASSYSKGLPHSPIGEVDRRAFDSLIRALKSGRAADFEAVQTSGVIRQVNPQAAYAFTLDGPDPQSLPLSPPPRFDSADQAADACELYWQALTRDAPFGEYGSNPLVARACAELSAMQGYRGPRIAGVVTPEAIFRGTSAGDLTGPYVSQFLWKEVPYGAIRLVPHVRTATAGLDYLVTWDDWLSVQNGAATASRHAGTYRYIRSARDLSAYVQLDFAYQPFLTACLVLFGMEGTTDVRRPYKGAPFDAAIPYRLSKTQSGFATLGVAHALDLLARVAKLALCHAWHHKWLVHRWLRPEAFGARIHIHRTGQAKYDLHDDILSSAALDLVFAQHQTFLLPQAYPEGAPLHPSYPSGHAVVAGACATVLKAFFEESFPIEEPVVARPDGLTLEPYKGPTLTVGGELNKLAANSSIGRSMAGIHWRYDAANGLRLGEAVALNLLREMRACHHERWPAFSLTLFDGSVIEA